MRSILKEKVEDQIGSVTLDINTQNTLSHDSINEIIALCEKLNSSQDVNVLFLSSARDEYFCNGIEPRSIQDDGIEKTFSAMLSMITRLYSIQKPMVASINGYAIAGGAVLGIMADYRFGNPKLKYAFNEILLGLTMPQMLFNIINNAVGPFHAKHLCQTGRLVKADEALSMGLVDNIFESEELYRKSLYFAKRLAKLNSESLCYIKKVSRQSVFESIKHLNKAEEEKIIKERILSPQVSHSFQRLLERSQNKN